MKRYEEARGGVMMREVPPDRLPEWEIQARLFSGEYGTRWVTNGGQPVEVLHFGCWNHEAGPDFKRARFRFADGEECEGDLEVDMDPRDWERHGHATNPAYNGVRLQIFVNPAPLTAFARTADFREVAQAQLLLGGPPSPPLRQAPGLVDREGARAMIAEAAEFRLLQKISAQARAVRLHGAETALFHAIASGLGYKNNAIPFLLAAQRAGLRQSGSADGEARLFGLSGFLQSRTFDDGDAPTRDYLKPLWEKWWTMRDANERLILPASAWRFSGVRPSNHPHRRMGALAAIAASFPRLCSMVRSRGLRGFEEFFEALDHPYWSRHWNLSAAQLDKPLALVGADRVRDLVINAYVPSLSPESALELLGSLPGTTPSGRVRLASMWLVGSVDHTIMKSALQQQGLLQLHADFGSLTALEAWARIRKVP